MSDKVGVLGESLVASIGTQTVYTVPAGKGAKFKLMFLLQGGSGGGSIVEFRVNGMPIGRISAMTASFYVYSTRGAGLRIAETATFPTGITEALTVAPSDMIYYASAGDVVEIAISGAACISMNCQIVGVEIDV